MPRSSYLSLAAVFVAGAACGAPQPPQSHAQPSQAAAPPETSATSAPQHASRAPAAAESSSDEPPPPATRGPEAVALRAFEFASAGDWTSFEREFVIPPSAFATHVERRAGEPDDKTRHADYTKALWKGFDALRGAREPVVQRVDDDGKRGLRGHVVELTFTAAAGRKQTESFRIYRVAGTLYAWDLD